jgi:hypothetical protein
MKRSANGSRQSVKVARAALAAKIEDEKRVDRAAARIKAAIDGSYAQSAAARRKLERGEAAIKKAAEDDVEAAAKAVAAGRSPPPPTIEIVRGKVREDEEMLERIGVGRQRLEQKKAEAEHERDDVRRAKEAAIDDVLRAEFGPLAELLDEEAKLWERFTAKRLMLRVWSFLATTPTEERRVIQGQITRLVPGGLGETHQFEQHPIMQALAEMRAVLARDSNAPIEKL